MKLKSFFLLFLFHFVGIQSQELPPIVTYQADEYQAGNQNWMISQAADKTIFIANNAGLLEFNNVKWTLYESPNGSVFRSVKVIDELIYTGCYMEFGYWKRDEFGILRYTSLVPKLNSSLVEDEQFWNILKVDDWVLFQSLNRIYCYNTTDESFTVIDSKTNRAKIFNVGENVLFQKGNEGVFKIENGLPILVSDNAVLKKNVLIGTFQIGQRTLFLSEEGNFYFLDDTNLSQWDIEAGNELSSANVYSSVQLKDGSFMLGTISDGIYHIGLKGNLLNKINKEKGLYNNTILSIFEDIDENLWLGLDNGLSVLNLKSPFREYTDLKGEVGNVYAAKVFKNYLYIGTNQGLFYKKANTQEEFKLVKNTQGQVWCVLVLDDTLFCGHNNGTYEITEDSAKLVSDYPGTWSVKKIEQNDHLLLQGNYEGLSVIEKKNGQWSLRNKLEGFDFASRFFEFIGPYEIIVNNEYKGIFKLKLDSGFNKVLELENKPAMGYGSSLVHYNDMLLYTSNSDKRVLKYNPKMQKFELDSLLTSMFYGPSDHILGILMPDNATNRLWGFSDNNIINVVPSKFSNTLELGKIPVPKAFRRSLGISGFEFLTHLDNNRFLIGNSNGYTVLNLDRVISNDLTVSINSVQKAYLNSPNVQLSLGDVAELPFYENNLNFSFGVPEFKKYTEVTYQYQLLGLNDQWSDWFEDSNVSVENLRYGDYTFRVRARTGNQIPTNVASYSFVIQRPWYYSNWAIFCYLLGIVLILYAIHKLYKLYYKKQQALILEENQRKMKRKKLKAQKKIVQIKNEKLRMDIASKNRELAISTMSIIKKNEFLNSIKDQLKEVENSPKVKSVIRTINRSINNSDDWKFFEEAFNNADKDFLKKIKDIHPELTPNDLRLCAYLRLNLSSKEIAPLLNISVRSVEVKRYRLRKKMGLSHESGLTNYILQL